MGSGQEREKYTVGFWFDDPPNILKFNPEEHEKRVFTRLTESELGNLIYKGQPERKITVLYVLGNLPNIISIAPKLRWLRLSAFTEEVRKLGCFRTLHERLTYVRDTLEVLDISNNDLHEEGVPSWVREFPYLKCLDLSRCGLKDLPPWISELHCLEKLVLSHNQFENGVLPEVVCKLSKLRELYLVDCGLKTLPDNLENLKSLELLTLEANELTYFPDVIAKLTTLQQLYLPHNRISNLPESFGQLKALKCLNIRANTFRSLPSCIYQLNDLDNLNASGNKLTSVEPEIITLPKLEVLGLTGCTTLRSPPSEVCEQGIESIRQYFVDLSTGVRKTIPAVTMAVIGQKMSGKTSLIRTLQNKMRKRVLTNREPGTAVDEATKVFNMEKVEVGDNILRFLDLGGHEVYHPTYHMTLKNSCIPVIVVNITKFQELATDPAVGPKEAVRTLCFDWMSHLYVSCPKLGPPTLVFTHKDKLTLDDSVSAMQSFLFYCEEIRTTLLEEEEKRDGVFCKIDHMSNTEVQLFDRKDVYIISDDPNHYDTFNRMLISFQKLSGQFERELPEIWIKIINHIESLVGTFIIFRKLKEDLVHKFQAKPEQISVVLTYLHDSGALLWYPDLEELRPYVFHNIPALTGILSVFFNHASDDIWAKRIKEFKPFLDSKDHLVELEEFEEHYQTLQESGIMNAQLLYHLIQTESEFSNFDSVSVALGILHKFKLMFGPIRHQGKPAFVLPFFSDGYHSDSLPYKEYPLRFRIEINFKGLALPQYLYHAMSIDSVLKCFRKATDTLRLVSNGVTVYHKKSVLRFTHDFKSRKAIIEMTADVGELAHNVWATLQKVTKRVIFDAKHGWSAARFVCIFFCPHCLIKGSPHPRRKVNPDWCFPSLTKLNPVRKGGLHYNWDSIDCAAMEPVTCGSDMEVPYCLTGPGDMSADEITQLTKYINDITPSARALPVSRPTPLPRSLSRPAESVDSVQPPIPSPRPTKRLQNDTAMSVKPIAKCPVTENGGATRVGGTLSNVRADMTNTKRVMSSAQIPQYSDESDLSDGDGYLDPQPDEDYKYLIRLRVAPTSKPHIKSLFINTDKAYKMSNPVRGRALVINNERFSQLSLTRKGSSVDVKNIELVLKSLKFEIAEPSTGTENLYAKEMLSAIREETQNPDHEDYGMFALVIMSHGTEDECILGSDVVSVKLKHICDLLSPKNFPGMAGKPKLVIVQACAGYKPDLGGSETVTADTSLTPTLKVVDYHVSPSAASSEVVITPGGTKTEINNEKTRINMLNVDDLLIMRSSFESYMSIRNENSGSLFIRTLVTTLYKHACHRDMWSLFEIVQERVRRESIAIAERHPGVGFGQTVIANKTFTKRRKLYLFPGCSAPRE